MVEREKGRLHAVPLIRDIVRDTFWRLVKFLGKIRDRLVLGNKFTVTIEIFNMKLPYNEATFWDTRPFKILENFWDRLV